MAEPTRATIAGAPAGFNCRLSVSGYGSYAVRVERIRYSVEIHAESAAAANYRVFYPGWLQDPQFALAIVHLTAAERDRFNDWMAAYMRKVTSSQIAEGAMSVQVPVRRFNRTGVPLGTLVYGDSVGQAGSAYRTDLVFGGAYDPVSRDSISKFRAAKKDASTSANFYPAAAQKGGAETLAGTIFDTAKYVDMDTVLGGRQGGLTY